MSRSLLYFAGFLVPTAGTAQAVLKGTVRQDSTGVPLVGVEVLADGVGKHTTSDRNGNFILKDLPYGPQTILFRQIGFRPARRGVLLLRGDTIKLDVLLISESAQRLEPIAVEAPSKTVSHGVRDDLENRRRLGLGKFIDSADLHRNESRQLGDLLRGIPGINVVVPPYCRRGQVRDCLSSRTAQVAVSSRMMTRRCFVEVVLDGIVVSKGGSDTVWEQAYDLSMLRLSEIEAVEVYRSAGEIPAEFNSASAACGVLVIWSRR